MWTTCRRPVFCEVEESQSHLAAISFIQPAAALADSSSPPVLLLSRLLPIVRPHTAPPFLLPSHRSPLTLGVGEEAEPLPAAGPQHLLFDHAEEALDLHPCVCAEMTRAYVAALGDLEYVH
uniref:Uncharacterized protein n=1 Tax=Triticum urartu TaxID=4572 RepID=A0A8R7PPB5_TRIUA